MESLFIILIGLFIVSFIALYFWSIVWGYKDAIDRGKNGFAVATLIALFAWPFGLLFWTIIRPEEKKNKEKSKDTKKDSSLPNKYISDFKDMPFLMKLLLFVSFYSFFTNLLDLIQMKPIEFQYFNSGFPKNYPFIWYLYYLLYDTVSISVFFKRSYSVLKKYLFVSLGILVISIINSVYFVVNLPSEQRMVSTYVYTFSYLFGGLIFVYLFKQKKYFFRT